MVDGVVRSIGSHQEPVSAVRWHDAATASSAGWDGMLVLWDISRATSRAELKAHECRVLGMDSDGQLSATAGYDGTIRLWDWRSEQQVLQFGGRSDTGCSYCIQVRISCLHTALRVSKH